MPTHLYGEVSRHTWCDVGYQHWGKELMAEVKGIDGVCVLDKEWSEILVKVLQ